MRRSDLVSGVIVALAALLICSSASASGPSPAPGQPKDRICVASGGCSGAGLQVGQSIMIVKANDTARTSTTTITADPDLQLTNVPAGFYLATFHLEVGVVSTEGFSFYLAGASARGTQNGQCSSTSLSITFAPNLVVGDTSATAWNPTAADVGWIDCWMPFSQSVAGTVSIAWAQSVSSASATTVFSSSGLAIGNKNSWLRLYRYN